MKSNNLSSFQSQKRVWFLFISFIALLFFVPLYFVGIWMHSRGWVTPLFAQTILWCIIPFFVAVRLHYKSLNLPAAEFRMVIPVNSFVPFLLLILTFALLQMNYSRGAVAMCGFTLLIWYMLADRWIQAKFKLELLLLHPSSKNELLEQLGKQAAVKFKELTWVLWPDNAELPPTCDGVLISIAHPLSSLQMKQLAVLKQMHVRIYSSASVCELLTGRIGDTDLKNTLWHPEGNPAYDIAKRIIDLMLVLVTSPVWIFLGIIVAMAVKWDSNGPVIFTQERTGQHGKSFKIYKFRTMVYRPKDSPQFAQKNDKRITKLGHFLRKSRLDEIPQLINVIMGSMSLIGPRPEQYTFVNEFSVSIPSYPYRHLVRPGITGWAQVMQGYAASEEETSVKLSYDLYYVKHYSIALDLLISFKTIKTVLTGFGAR